ncbi:MAG: glycosyltransferase family 4 protein [Alphaproteobacteria bacterium]|nr:glycosyltransferase family 4 protein [Alphaproteobacteria bacterium]
MSVRRRILLVEGSGRGFLCHYAHALGLGLSRLGCEVELVTGRRDELAGWDMPFAKSACLDSGLAGWMCLARKVRSFKPDAVHFQWVGQPLLAALFAIWVRRLGIGVVYTPHNLLPHRRRWLSAPLYHLFYRLVDWIVARDAHLAWGLEEMLGVGPERIAAIPGSPNLLAHPIAPRTQIPELPQRQPGEIRLLYFGHGSPRKGLDLLLAAFEEMEPNPAFHLVIAGEGVMKGIDGNALGKAALHVRTTVIGRYIQSGEVAGLFENSDLMIMPYAKQCKSPLTDLAAAFRLPVLKTDRVEAACFADGVHGYTIEGCEPALLARAILECTYGPTLTALKEELAREETVEDSIARLAQAHAALYEMLGSELFANVEEGVREHA